MIVYSKELKVGMKLKQPLYYGNFLLIDKDNILTDVTISKLEGYGINYVDVYEEHSGNENDFSKVLEQENIIKDIFQTKYKSSINTTKLIIENIEKGEINKSDIENVIQETIDNLEIDKNILIGLLEGDMGSDYLFVHTMNTVTFALIIGMALEYSKEKMESLGKAAFLHDIGMAKIPKSILNKEAELTNSELVEIRKHPLVGAELSKKMEEEVIEAIKYHHERMDGSGYPEGLIGNKIPEMARIIAIADVYSALTENRVYRSKYSYYDAMKIMMQSSAEVLDSRILKQFLKYMPIYPINSMVYLNDGKLGKVVKANPNPFRPVIDIEDDGRIIRIDLTDTENLTKYIIRAKNS